jgi:hypothetical protein
MNVLKRTADIMSVLSVLSSAKAQAAEFLNWGIYLVVLGLVLGFGSIILTGFTTSGPAAAYCANTLSGNILYYGGSCTTTTANTFVAPIAYNTVTSANSGLATMGNYLPTIALVVVASGMIMLIVRSLVGAVNGGGRGGQI